MRITDTPYRLSESSFPWLVTLSRLEFLAFFFYPSHFHDFAFSFFLLSCFFFLCHHFGLLYDLTYGEFLFMVSMPFIRRCHWLL